MLKVASDVELRRQLASRGLARAQHFNWKKSAIETLHIFDEFN